MLDTIYCPCAPLFLPPNEPRQDQNHLEDCIAHKRRHTSRDKLKAECTTPRLEAATGGFAPECTLSDVDLKEHETIVFLYESSCVRWRSW